MSKNLISQIIQLVKEEFKENVSCLLHYGSSVSASSYSDLDLLLILKDNNGLLDKQKVIQIIEKFKGHTLDFQLFYLQEVKNPRVFSLDAHGAFFIEILKRAEVLIGQNIFMDMSVSTSAIQVSIINKIQYYVFRARQEFLGIGRFSKDKNPYFHQKKIKRIIQDILIFYGIDSKATNYIETFMNKFPDILTSEEVSQITLDTDGLNYAMLNIYEKLFKFIMGKSELHLPGPELKPQRLIIDGIVTDYLLNKQSKEVAVILVDGLPSLPDQQRLLNVINKIGYTVFFPRFKGTWESSGEFLEKSPSVDIQTLMDRINNGVTLNDAIPKYSKFILVSTSFGGNIAMELVDNILVKKIFCYSPVFQFHKVIGIESLGDFLSKSFPGAYRYNQNNWGKLINDELTNSLKIVRKSNNKDKLKLYLGDKDKNFDFDYMLTLIKNLGIDYFIYTDTGHISFSKINGMILEDLINELI